LTTNFEQDKYEDNIISSNDYNTRRYKMNLNLFDNSASIITTPLDTRKSVKNISSLSVQTRQAEQNLKEAVKTLELEKQNVEYGIRQTNQNIEKLKLEFKIYNETIGFQQKRVELAEVKFKMGELKPVDLLTTYLDLYESKKQKLEVWYDYIFNNFTYKYLTGKLNFSDGVD
jgi:outer membrane protein TolC